MRLVKLCYDLELLISKGLFVSVLRKTSPRKNIPGNLPTRTKFPRKPPLPILNFFISIFAIFFENTSV